MMRNRRGMDSVPRPDTGPDTTEAAGEYAPRKMTFGENVILTIKVLLGFGLLGATLCGINLWTAAK